MNEQIQKAIDIAVDKRLSETLSIFSLPLISQYTIVTFHGAANGTDLTVSPINFINNISGKTLVLKSIKLVPYYSADGIDINFSDGTTETVYNNTRIERIFDFFTTGTELKIFINEILLTASLSLFNPIDLFVDNIFYKFPQKVQNMRVQVNARVVQDLSTGAAAIPNIRVQMECYLI